MGEEQCLVMQRAAEVHLSHHALGPSSWRAWRGKGFSSMLLSPRSLPPAMTTPPHEVGSAERGSKEAGDILSGEAVTSRPRSNQEGQLSVK